MAVWIAIVFLLDHFQSCSALSCWRTDLFYRLLFSFGFITFLKMAFHFLLDLRSELYSIGNVHFHRLWFRQSNITLPWVPFCFTHEIEHWRLWRIAITHCGLLVKTVNGQFILVRDGCWSLGNVLCRIFEQLGQNLKGNLLFSLLSFNRVVLLWLVFGWTEKDFFEEVHGIKGKLKEQWWKSKS